MNDHHGQGTRCGRTKKTKQFNNDSKSLLIPTRFQNHLRSSLQTTKDNQTETNKNKKRKGEAGSEFTLCVVLTQIYDSDPRD